MKKLFISLLLVLCSIDYTYSQGIVDAPSDKAVVYFVRPEFFGFAVNFTYYDNSKVIGKFNGQKYMAYTCDPGEHLFMARCENWDFVEAELEAGRVYFIHAKVEGGAMKAAVSLEPLNPNDPETNMKKIYKMIDKKAGQTFSSYELKELNMDIQDDIDLGMKKYNRAKEKGKKVEVLEKDMFLVK